MCTLVSWTHWTKTRYLLCYQRFISAEYSPPSTFPHHTCSFSTKNGVFSASILRNLLSRCLGASSPSRISMTLHLIKHHITQGGAGMHVLHTVFVRPGGRSFVPTCRVKSKPKVEANLHKFCRKHDNNRWAKRRYDQDLESTGWLSRYPLSGQPKGGVLRPLLHASIAVMTG